MIIQIKEQLVAEPTKKNNLWIGFDLGGTKMLAIAFDNNYKVLARERKKTKTQENSVLSIERIIKTIRNTLSQISAESINPAGIGIGVPGTLDLNKGIILEAPNLGWKKMPLKALLEKEFSCPVVLSNDVDAGVYGEYRFGSAKNTKSVLGIFPGTGIGGGLIYNGDIYSGEKTSCLEIGHIPVVQNGIPCGCGRNGCLETVASRLAIAAAAAMAVFRGEAPNLAKITGTDIANIRSGALAQSIAAGDKKIELIVRNAAQILGRSIGGIINILAPQIVVLGGGLVEAMPELYLQEVQTTARQIAMPSFADIYKIVVASLGDDATAMGAAAWTRKFFEQSINKK
jgi:glucokinase